eukprot:TRINITY_DN50177_c0_g1_i3.p3 TRINITY_DN50177_c0_g1~~TRINITY_DN50177_c0_g1_i3.p3  ORF type:complete len:103 (-),score=25.15 TRINITY_DN50177_c0_g1_i3:176-484(-)
MGNKFISTEKEEEEEFIKLREMKPRLYTYPDSKEFSTVFEFEDLSEDGLFCLCVKAKSKIYIYTGIDFSESEDEKKEFINAVTLHCWGKTEGVEQSLSLIHI